MWLERNSWSPHAVRNSKCSDTRSCNDFVCVGLGHAFCSTCSDAILRNARCTFCECSLSNEDVSTCVPNIRGQNSMALCGWDFFYSLFQSWEMSLAMIPQPFLHWVQGFALSNLIPEELKFIQSSTILGWPIFITQPSRAWKIWWPWQKISEAQGDDDRNACQTGCSSCTCSAN